MPAPRPSALPVAAEKAIACLDALAAEFKTRGWTAHVATAPPRHPRLLVQDPGDDARCEHVLAAPADSTGDWWFWYPWAERISPADDTRNAADKVVQLLRATSTP
ncbi:MAG TPA: hypothetical protein VMV07_05405 [Streptosporangiaceae bacterium]|nr:hypothetical protein [Streptosporangiaceae bacterium]